MTELQKQIILELKVLPVIDAKQEVEKRVGFLRDFLRKSNLNGLVLGLSGGQDSTLAGKLAQMAATAENKTFIAMKLPYGVQLDMEDVDKAIEFIKPEIVLDFNIKPIVDAACSSYKALLGKDISDFGKGNIKARERMVVQYAIAGERGMAVVGTDHAAENLMGFYTKWGDGAADVVPLFGLNKSQGAELLSYLGGPPEIMAKEPTADLLDNHPCRPDEDELSIKYTAIDSFLRGETVDEDVYRKIVAQYHKTQHKRRMPLGFGDEI